jgi:succinate dehydrogenase flavin-adding protein (antitoxin of CptAB toxin-antitoxin module)
MRELDQLLLEYVDSRYVTAGSRERDAFVRLLDLPDPDLFGYLVGLADVPEESLRDVVARIRNRAF